MSTRLQVVNLPGGRFGIVFDRCTEEFMDDENDWDGFKEASGSAFLIFHSEDLLVVNT